MHTAFRLSGQAWKGPKDGSDQQLEGYLRCRTIQMRKLELSDHTMIKKIGYKIVQGRKTCFLMITSNSCRPMSPSALHKAPFCTVA